MSSVTKDSPLEALLRFYAAEESYSSSDEKNFAPIEATLHPEIVLYQPESLPYGGVWRGHSGFQQWLQAFSQAWSIVQPRNPEFFQPSSETLISLVTMRAQSRSTMKIVEMPMCQIIRIKDGLPIEWRNFAWDTVVLNEALNSTFKIKIHK